MIKLNSNDKFGNFETFQTLWNSSFIIAFISPAMAGIVTGVAHDAFSRDVYIVSYDDRIERKFHYETLI